MRKPIFIIFASIGIALVLAACGAQTPPTEIPDLPQVVDAPSGPTPAPAPKPASEDDKTKYTRLGNEIVDKKGDIVEAIKIYEKLTTLYPKDDPMRQKVLQYIMKGTLELVNSQKAADVQSGLDLSLELYKLLPGDYYVENRIIGAYVFYAKAELAKKNWRKADEWVMKGLKMRFHIEAMRTHMLVLIGEAGDFVAAKKYSEARTNLNEVISIASIDENKTIFVNEKAKAQAELDRIPK